MMQALYFAYGSNMSSERLYSRIASVKVVGRAFLKNMRVMFNKRSKDGSGKANLVESSGCEAWGVLYEIDIQDLYMLDRVEGGYDRATAQVWKCDGKAVEAVMYVSTNLTDDPRAYDWYKALVLSGARENKLPQYYIVYLEGLLSKPSVESETAG